MKKAEFYDGEAHFAEAVKATKCGQWSGPSVPAVVINHLGPFRTQPITMMPNTK